MTLREAWLKEEQRAMVGWDFGALHGRLLEEPLPWDYRAIVMHQLSPDVRLLDMDTGGRVPADLGASAGAYRHSLLHM